MFYIIRINYIETFVTLTDIPTLHKLYLNFFLKDKTFFKIGYIHILLYRIPRRMCMNTYLNRHCQ